MAPHSSTLAWKIPWMEEPGGLQSMRSLRVGHDWESSLSLFTFMHWGRKWQPTPVFLPGESQRQGSLVGCRLWSRTRVGHDWSDLAAAAASVRQKVLEVKSLMIKVKIGECGIKTISDFASHKCLGSYIFLKVVRINLRCIYENTSFYVEASALRRRQMICICSAESV